MPPETKPPLYEYLAAFYDEAADTHTPALVITARSDEDAAVMATLLRCANNDAPVHILGRIGRDMQVLETGMPVPIRRDTEAGRNTVAEARLQLGEIFKRR